MIRRILEIGRGRYKFNNKTLDDFIEESRHRRLAGGRQDAGFPSTPDSAGEPDDRELPQVFEEVMTLYHDYQQCESIELLVKLKFRLQEVSIRYQSHVLASEVLNINSCLPYERRVSCQRDPSI
jgi:hypothetical protein